MVTLKSKMHNIHICICFSLSLIFSNLLYSLCLFISDSINNLLLGTLFAFVLLFLEKEALCSLDIVLKVHLVESMDNFEVLLDTIMLT